MTAYPWTAAELWELAKGLPDEARPKDLELAQSTMVGWPPFFRERNGEPMSIHNAVMLHESAVLRWLVGGPEHWVEVYRPGEGHNSEGWFAVEVSDDGLPTGFVGPTLLHALVAAAKAVGK